ncbi:SDR family NAD(P)-dependent oxidoreductase, partial [Klebsiella quasipneumoniae]|uniref:SDR family NAD(P)-dependent oxidoreductase n=1 Tax=Klebsiella quasipneumoniae TaxID=1463165 RepID=UPI0027309ACC
CGVVSTRFFAGRFDDRVVVVTGAAQGIGRGVAERISAEGGSVALVDRSELVHDIAIPLKRSHSVTADLETFEGAQHAIDSALE